MKYNAILSIVGKVLLTLLLVMPILGTLGIFPAPTADMYQTPEAFQFINLLMQSKYIMVINSVVYLITLYCLWTRRTALAALLLLPISINIVGFHAFLDGGLFTGGAVMGNVLLLLNLAFLWQQRANYKSLWEKRT
ncbi:hypothetical protein KBD61_01185 [Patescibacteria group bacterium]|nr:hypothetical protein [Patescibacteria group bacterium]MBP9709622.1 hypothetical protein [Patescibacteria group bacterium]